MNTVKIRVQDSLISGLINGIINGFIALTHFKQMDSVPMSLNVISHSQTSVWGQAVSLTFGLGIILSLITSKLFTRQIIKLNPNMQDQLTASFWSTQLPIAFSHAAALFGWFVVTAVIWTKYIGEVAVSSTTAAFLVGAFAFLVTIIVEIRTKRSVIYRKISIFDK
ncbi:permease [Vibrio mimicus]